jgi:ribosomal protein L2
MTVSTFEEIDRVEPEKSLLVTLKKQSGKKQYRQNNGTPQGQRS